ncbi:DnaJ domain-containing protein [bacterium]|nr:DnaJ domain-containing protein [bacterium]
MVREVKDYYQILGVEPTATTEEIKRRFRELVRRYHPDVHPDKLFSHEIFRQILEAYKVLGDPEKRRIYDSLRKGKTPVKEVLVEVPTKPPVDLEGLLLRAEIALIRGNLKDAVELCNEVLKKDPRNAFAYNLLGDIFRAQGRIKEAIEMYSYAVQFDPHKPIYAEKLNKLLKGERGVETIAEERIRTKPFSIFLFSLGLLSLIPICWWISHNPGTVIKNFPFANFSLNLIIALSLAGVSLGFFSGCSRFLRRHDEELIFALSWIGKGYLPLGLILCIFSFAFFWGSLILYAIISAIQEHTSLSVWKAYLLSILGILAIAFSLLPIWKSIILWGGNFVLPFFFIGWLIGDIFRPIGS